MKPVTWHTVGGHVEVVGSLPGTFIFIVEVGDLDGVGYVDSTVAVYAISVTRVTRERLVSDGELVRAQSRQLPRTRFVVNFTSQFLTITLGSVAVEVEVQRLGVCDRQRVVEVDVLLLEVVFNVGSSDAAREIVSELIGCATNVGRC